MLVTSGRRVLPAATRRTQHQRRTSTTKYHAIAIRVANKPRYKLAGPGPGTG